MGYWDTLGASNEWYTPPEIFNALDVTFDLDVAAPGDTSELYVPATRFLSRDALAVAWVGFVWMNPPFGGRNGVRPWLDRFFQHGNGIALTPDRTSAPWFWEAWHRADAVLFTPKIKFIRPGGERGKSPSNGTALWASGDRASAALVRANRNGLGILGIPTGCSSRLTVEI